ncbi:STAS domain-containing protein [bacterium]|nr:STAS domain-containing protein [bacterium]
MFSCDVDNKNRQSIYVVQGDLTIENATDFHDVMKKIIGDQKKVILDLSKAEHIDLAGLQLLCSVNHRRTENEEPLNIKIKIPDEFFDTAKRAGFPGVCRSGINEADCIWKKGVNS